eukprot:TRINITY_DN3116_c0_g2_i2.p1 TRINITY_DN3116_c0_g2~~TRINITY_DN3116_c0_g2_i2.p1  ORF type:complete len:478 (+),score=85.18 TRINITY_DN3116_c0_g2_i2:373-1806(+)
MFLLRNEKTLNGLKFFQKRENVVSRSSLSISKTLRKNNHFHSSAIWNQQGQITRLLNDKYDLFELERKGKMLNIVWGDKITSKYHYIWLRDHCRCNDCVHPNSGQKQFNSADLPPKISPSQLSFSKLSNEDEDASQVNTTETEEGLDIKWNDGHLSHYPLSWLRDNSYSLNGHPEIPEAGKVTLWDRQIMNEIVDSSTGLPTVKYNQVMENESGLEDWVFELQNLGISLIRKAPLTVGTVQKIAERISFVRETMYGKIFDVVSVPNPINIAYSSEKLELHQDLLYFESVPGIQLLHCIKSKAKGGENIFVDGFQAAELLRLKHPDHFDLLTNLKTTYHKQGEDHSLVHHRSIIQVDEQGRVVGINWSPQFVGTIRVPFEKMEMYYEAIKHFTKITRSSELMLVYRMIPGDIISFDNRRILHARAAFDKNSGERHLQGTYIGYDEFISKYRTLLKRQEDEVMDYEEGEEAEEEGDNEK